ncbi:MAG: pectin acetylesterase-family hydrolase [Chloroflexota bacterium]
MRDINRNSPSNLYRIDVNTSIYTKAVYNDGTSAIIYVRRALTNSVNADKWHIHLQGGGSCGNGTSCARRWLSSRTNFGAGKMSNRFAPRRGINGNGILSASLQNTFGDWNHVFMYYGSSDSWQGRRGNVLLETAWYSGTPPIHNHPSQYLIHFRGADIIDAVIDMLRTGTITYTTPSGDILMPDLDDAEQVLLSGSSAGGVGVIYNADRIGTFLQTNNQNIAGLDFRAVVDAAYTRSYATRDYLNTPMCQIRGLCSYDLMMTNEWLNVHEALLAPDPITGTVSVEDSCENNESGTEWKCADEVHVLENHVATTLFVRQDLQDSLFAGSYAETDYGSHGDFGLIKEMELRRFHADDPTRGVFGPQCGNHTGMRHETTFFDEDIDGQGTTFHNLLSNWLISPTSIISVTAYQEPGIVNGCP